MLYPNDYAWRLRSLLPITHMKQQNIALSPWISFNKPTTIR